MTLSVYFKSIIDQDTSSVVICDLNDMIIYMNPAAKENYRKHNGGELTGRSILDCHNAASGEKIHKVVSWFQESRENNRIFTFHNAKQNKDVYMVALRDEDGKLIGYYEKHEYRNPETAETYAFGKA